MAEEVDKQEKVRVSPGENNYYNNVAAILLLVKSQRLHCFYIILIKYCPFLVRHTYIFIIHPIPHASTYLPCSRRNSRTDIFELEDCCNVAAIRYSYIITTLLIRCGVCIGTIIMCEIIIITIYIWGIYISNDYYTGRPEDPDAGASANGHDCRKVGGPVITGRESSIGQVKGINIV